jgi:flagellar hook-associated protein 1 FlgK
MGSLMVALYNAAGAMSVFERGINLVETNVANVSTPGYAKQSQIIYSRQSDLDRGLAGGIVSGGTRSSRDALAERSVRNNLQAASYADEFSNQLSRFEAIFNISDGGGGAGALDNLFQSFSALAVSPNDPAARQLTLDRAAEAARAFNQMAQGLADASTSVEAGIRNATNSIDSLASQIRDINSQFKKDAQAQNDSGLDARLNSLLEELSDKVDFTTLRDEDGSVSIFIGGQTPLLIGEHLYAINAQVGSAGTTLADAQGRDITSQIGGGRLGALLNLRNNTLPGYQAQLDQLATAIADTVNTQLAAGLDSTGNAPAQALFTYDATLGAARTLQVNALQPGDLALAAQGAPGGNGNALALAALAQAPIAALSNQTFAQAYGTLSAQAGRDLSSAQSSASVAKDLTAQAKDLREQISQIDLNEEAIMLLQFQRAYEASAKMVQTLDQMTAVVMDMLS